MGRPHLNYRHDSDSVFYCCYVIIIFYHVRFVIYFLPSYVPSFLSLCVGEGDASQVATAATRAGIGVQLAPSFVHRRVDDVATGIRHLAYDRTCRNRGLARRYSRF